MLYLRPAASSNARRLLSTGSARVRRSSLYMPGSNSRALAKARIVPADVIIMDLEDAVAPSAKADARAAVAAALREREAYGDREIVVRVNHGSTPWSVDDVLMICQAEPRFFPDAVVLPKVESASEIEAVAAKVLDALKAAARSNSLKTNTDDPDAPTLLSPIPTVWAMIETPRGVLAADEIAAATAAAKEAIEVQVAADVGVPSLSLPPPCLLMGTADLAKELRVAHSTDRAAMVTALQQCVLAGRAHQLDVLDGVHLDLDDDDGFKRACRQGRAFGFDGKTLIHPRTIDAANLIFSPPANEVERARRIVEAYEEATREGKGVTTLDGRLVEILHRDEALRTLHLARTIADKDRRMRSEAKSFYNDHVAPTRYK